MHFVVGRVGPVVVPEVKVGVLCFCVVRSVVGLVVGGVGASCSRLCCLWCHCRGCDCLCFFCAFWLSLTDSVLTKERGQGNLARGPKQQQFEGVSGGRGELGREGEGSGRPLGSSGAVSGGSRSGLGLSWGRLGPVAELLETSLVFWKSPRYRVG